MTAIVFTPAHSWVGAHRVPMIVLSFAITLAVAATFAIVLFAASSSPPTTTTVPVQEEEPIGTHVACGLARLVGC